MKTTVLQLETYESRQSILDKLSRINGGRILLVWPKRGTLDLSEADLVLIERAAAARSVSLALVSHSPQVIDLARAHAINIFESIPAAEHSRWIIGKRMAGQLTPLNQIQSDQSPERLKRKPVSVRSKKIEFWTSAVLSGLAILSLCIFLLPSAKVSLSAKKQEKTVEIQVWGSPKFTSVNVNGNIPLVEKTIEISNSKTFQSSGKVAIPNAYASAMVQFTNLTTQDLVIPMGTIVSSDEEPTQRFATDSEISLGTGNAATESVSVKALIPGSSANVPIGAIQLVEGSLGGWVEVTNTEAASGGLDSEAPSPSEADYSAARNSLLEELKSQAASKFSSDPVFKLLPDSIKVSKVIAETRSVEVGQPGEQGILTLNVEVTALGYSQSDLRSLALKFLQAGLQPDEVIYDSTPNLSEPTNIQADGQGGFKWVNTATILVGAKIDPAQIAQLIAGQKFDAATLQIQNSAELVKAPEYRLFLSPFQLPWAAFRIQVEVQ